MATRKTEQQYELSEEAQLFLIGVDMDISDMMASMVRMRKSLTRSEFRGNLHDFHAALNRARDDLKELKART